MQKIVLTSVRSSLIVVIKLEAGENCGASIRICQREDVGQGVEVIRSFVT